MISTLDLQERRTKRWFVMHASSDIDRIETRLRLHQGVEDVFVPRRYDLRKRAGKTKREKVPLLPGYVFVHASQLALVDYKRLDNALKFSVWTDVGTDAGQTHYLWVPTEEMDNFIRVCRHNEEQVEYFMPGEIDLRPGERIEVIGGDWTGVKGWFQRVEGKRSRRLVVRLDNILAAVVSISPDLVRRLDGKEIRGKGKWTSDKGKEAGDK